MTNALLSVDTVQIQHCRATLPSGLIAAEEMESAKYPPPEETLPRQMSSLDPAYAAIRVVSLQG